MNTISEWFDGVEIIRPAGDFKWPHPTFSGFPECCGAGPDGSIGNEIVPETILGLNVSPACCVHDWMFGNGPKNWQSFHYANAVFLVNLLQIIDRKSSNRFLAALRKPVALAWFSAVSSVAGVSAFFNQGGKP